MRTRTPMPSELDESTRSIAPLRVASASVRVLTKRASA